VSAIRSKAVLSLGLLAGLLAASCASRTVTAAWRAGASPPAPQATLAVVPFENLSHNRNGGLILTDLATSVVYARNDFRVTEVSRLNDETAIKLRRLDVSPWERQVGLNTETALEVGRALKTDWVLVGSVGEYGFVDGFGETANVGLSLRLVKVESGEVVWAGSLSRRAACGAFSEESVHRLAHEVLVDLLNQMFRDIDEHRRGAGPAS
jgi:TolB-like protein